MSFFPSTRVAADLGGRAEDLNVVEIATITTHHRRHRHHHRGLDLPVPPPSPDYSMPNLDLFDTTSTNQDMQTGMKPHNAFFGPRNSKRTVRIITAPKELKGSAGILMAPRGS